MTKTTSNLTAETSEAGENTRTGESGVIALEAVISLTFFVFFVLSIYSLTILFMSQYMIGHALSESSQSLSLETYATDKLTSDWSISSGLNRLVLGIAGGGTQTTDFITHSDWYESGGHGIPALCKTRFAAYLAGDEASADRLLRALGVQGGLEGIDFSKTKLDGDDLTISVQYKIRSVFGADFLGLGIFDGAQSVCSRLWK